jgi:hypothetical protein
VARGVCPCRAWRRLGVRACGHRHPPPLWPPARPSRGSAFDSQVIDLSLDELDLDLDLTSIESDVFSTMHCELGGRNSLQLAAAGWGCPAPRVPTTLAAGESHGAR